MNRSIVALLLVTTTLIAISCRQPPTASAAGARVVAEKEIGLNIEEFPNASGQYVLFTQKQTPGQIFRFVVIESSTSAVVERGSVMPGYIKWLDINSLEVLSVPGIVRVGEDLSRYIRVIRIRQNP